MKLSIFSFLLIIFTYNLYPQTRIINESFNGNKYIVKLEIDPLQYQTKNIESKKIVEFTGFQNESKPGELENPAKDFFIPLPPNSNPKISLTVDKKITIPGQPAVNPLIEVINDSTVNYKYTNVPSVFVKHNLFENKGYLWIGKHYCLHLKVYLTEFNLPKKQINVIKEFTLTTNFKRNFNRVKNFTNNSSKLDQIILRNKFFNYTGNPKYNIKGDDSWIDYTKTYVKIGAGKDGIYRILPQDLTALGIDINQIDPKTFRLINKGNELPIFVKGEGDNHFDQSDYIEFPGIRNMGGHHREVAQFGQPYNEYLGRYSDTTVYWLTWGGDLGKRVNVSNGDLQLTASDTLKYYNEILHHEINNWFDFSMQDPVRRELPYWFENKSWFEGQIGVGVRNRTFSVSDIYPNEPVKLFVKVQDYASNIIQNAHLLSLSLNSNSNVYDSTYMDKYETKVYTAVISSNVLQEGNNTLKIHYYSTSADPNKCQLDWDEEEYPRYLNAINDSLDFRFHYLSDSSVYTVKINNLSSNNLTIWKYGNSFKKYQLNNTSNSVIFKDTLTSENKFSLIDEQRVSSPKFYYVKQFKNLRAQSNTGQYIAITNKKFMDKCLEYIQFISNNYNLTTKAIDVDDIYDEFAYGYFNPESIRDFLETAYMNWQEPKPEYVFLIGSANYDYYGYKVKNFGAPPKYNYVPSFGAPVSDNWFIIWDTTGANIPQLNIGRLPISTNEKFDNYLQKHRTYVSQSYNDWNKNYLFSQVVIMIIRQK